MRRAAAVNDAATSDDAPWAPAPGCMTSTQRTLGPMAVASSRWSLPPAASPYPPRDAVPGQHRLAGGPPHGDDQPEVVALGRVVEEPGAVPGDRRVGVERQVLEVPAELAGDRVHERVEEQVRPGDAEVGQQVLHPAARLAHERPMGQGLVRPRVLPDDEHPGLPVAQPPPVEHRAELPAEPLEFRTLGGRERAAQAPVVGSLGEQPRPAAVARRPGVVVPGLASPCPQIIHPVVPPGSAVRRPPQRVPWTPS